jgi:hypothetical protein
MKRYLMPVVALANAKKMLFAIFCCALLMLFTAPSWADGGDPCTSALPVGSATGCGVLITITGTSGHLVATVTGSGTANGNPYDGGPGGDDELIGIQNNTESVTIGAIRLSAPPINGAPYYTSNLFKFDGDGPCDYYYDDESTTYDCYNNGVFVGETQADPFDYEGPNNIFVGISPDYTTGTISFVTPIPPSGNTWLALEGSPATVVSIGETQQLVTGVTNVFPFGPFTCPPDGCGAGYGTWTEQSNGDDARFTPVSQLMDFDRWTVLPIPVCAGPLGESPFGAFTGTPSFGFYPAGYFGEGSPAYFGLEAPSPCPYGPPAFVTNYGPPPLPATGWGPLSYPNVGSMACVPYSDYTAAASGPPGPPPKPPIQPMCVEFQRDCIETGEANDCGTVQWTMQLDYDIDPNSIAGPIGGPAIGFAPGLPGPTSPTQALPFGAEVAITSWSITSNVATFQATNSLTAGENVMLSGFPTSTFFNQQVVSVLSTGLSGTQFEVAFTHASGLATEAGYASTPTDFSVNAITSYTGAVPGEDPPPPRGGGTDGKSVFASLFSPAQSETNPIPAGVTVGFPGHEFPTSNTSSPSCTPEAAQYLLFPSGQQVTITAPVNCLIKFLGIRLPWPLVWDYTTTSNTPITNLQLCPSVTGGTCNTPGVSPPWVHLSLVPVGKNCGTFTGQNPLPGIFTNLNNLGFPGQYSFVWTPVNNPKSCEVAPVLQFDNGTIVSPATFIYAY